MRITDIHVHTAHSAGDCTCPMERYLVRIDRGEADSVGFAEHYHPHLEVSPEALPEPPLDHEAYCAHLKAALDAGYPIHRGVEVTYDPRPEVLSQCQRQLLRYGYEYVIGSVHMVGKVSLSRSTFLQEVPGEWAVPDILRANYEEMLGICASPMFDVLGHVDVYKRDMPPEHPFFTRYGAIIEEGTREAARAAAKSDIIVEINTSGLHKPQGDYMPGKDFLRAYREYGGSRICFGSDAHTADRLCADFDKAAAYAMAMGFTELYYPWGKDTPVCLSRL